MPHGSCEMGPSATKGFGCVLHNQQALLGCLKLVKHWIPRVSGSRGLRVGEGEVGTNVSKRGQDHPGRKSDGLRTRLDEVMVQVSW